MSYRTMTCDVSSAHSSDSFIDSGDVLGAVRDAEAAHVIEGDGVRETFEHWSLERARFEFSLAVLESGRIAA